MTARLKVWVQRFPNNSAEIFNIKYNVQLTKICFHLFKRNSYWNILTKNVIRLSPVVLFDFWNDNLYQKVDFSASCKCLRIRAPEEVDNSIHIFLMSRVFDETLFRIFPKHETLYNAPVFPGTFANFARSNFRDFCVSRKL